MSFVSKLFTTKQKQLIHKWINVVYRIANNKRLISTKHPYIEFKNDGCDTFFGYYDISPFNNDGKIVYLELPSSSETINIILNNIDNSDKRYLAISHAWNWQQGTRLRWLNDELISFNDYINGDYCNRIINIKTNEERLIFWPLYDIDSNNELGLSLDFRRLGVMRPGYGYVCDSYNPGNIQSGGIDIIDFTNNKIIKTISIERIADSIAYNGNYDNVYLNHLSFSPSGSRFLFFFIEVTNNYHKASLIVYDISEDSIIPLELKGKVSHYAWKNDNEILCTTYSSRTECYYYLYSVTNQSKTRICPTSLFVDGHPSFISSTQLITDTYPDKHRFMHLSAVNIDKDFKEDILSVYLDENSVGETRTDLHPRLNHNKDTISIDVNYHGKRSLLCIKIDNYVQHCHYRI